jgi:response regulator RpfG family c-di-GMP phosphodiesterase
MQSQTRDVPAKPRRKPRQSCLVIEDSHFDQKRISRALEHGCQHLDLIFADTIAAAREHLAKTPVQMILLDNHLPDGVGADFAIELSNDPKHSKKPIVMVSDWPSPFMWDKANAAGVHHVVSKAKFHAGYVQSAMEQSARSLH